MMSILFAGAKGIIGYFNLIILNDRAQDIYVYMLCGVALTLISQALFKGVLAWAAENKKGLVLAGVLSCIGGAGYYFVVIA